MTNMLDILNVFNIISAIKEGNVNLCSTFIDAVGSFFYLV